MFSAKGKFTLTLESSNTYFFLACSTFRVINFNSNRRFYLNGRHLNALFHQFWPLLWMNLLHLLLLRLITRRTKAVELRIGVKLLTLIAHRGFFKMLLLSWFVHSNYFILIINLNFLYIETIITDS